MTAVWHTDTQVCLTKSLGLWHEELKRLLLHKLSKLTLYYVRAKLRLGVP